MVTFESTCTTKEYKKEGCENITICFTTRTVSSGQGYVNTYRTAAFGTTNPLSSIPYFVNFGIGNFFGDCSYSNSIKLARKEFATREMVLAKAGWKCIETKTVHEVH